MELQTILQTLGLTKSKPTTGNEIPEQHPDDVPEDPCPVCFGEKKPAYRFPCNHEVCLSCRNGMKAMAHGNGCVDYYPDTTIKVVRCPICRTLETPTAEEFITEIKSLHRDLRNVRRSQMDDTQRHANQIRALQGNNAPARAVRRAGDRRPARAGLPAQIDVLIPQPAPAPAHPAINGRWLLDNNFQPLRGEGGVIPPPGNMAEWPGVIPQYHILRGHPPEVQEMFIQMMNHPATDRRYGVDGGWIIGNIGDRNRHFYHESYFTPILTEGGTQSRRLCACTRHPAGNNTRTGRRCPRGCGQFICLQCVTCENVYCNSVN